MRLWSAYNRAFEGGKCLVRGEEGSTRMIYHFSFMLGNNYDEQRDGFTDCCV